MLPKKTITKDIRFERRYVQFQRGVRH
jgi:hypothetical protein